MDYDIFQQGGVKAQYSIIPLFQSTLRSGGRVAERSGAEFCQIHDISSNTLSDIYFNIIIHPANLLHNAM